MFISAEVVVNASFEAACERLTSLARDSWLLDASGDAHARWARGVARAGPAGAAPVLARLVRVRSMDLTVRDRVAVMVLRWEAAGPGGALLPVLDADVSLSRHGQSEVLLALTGAYRPPLAQVGAALDRAVLHRVATATIRRFVRRLGDALADPADARVKDSASGPGGTRRPRHDTRWPAA
jgi:hypothetical protein